MAKVLTVLVERITGAMALLVLAVLAERMGRQAPGLPQRRQQVARMAAAGAVLKFLMKTVRALAVLSALFGALVAPSHQQVQGMFNGHSFKYSSPGKRINGHRHIACW